MIRHQIALIGNPNTGKTTLFNRLTGSRQKVGNWPGVTVERKSGVYQHQSMQVDVVDLPGVYDLSSSYGGLDEAIARRYLQQDTPQLVINVVDGSNLKRNLVLTRQLLDAGLPLLVVVNMLDVAKQHGQELDLQRLAQELGVPVVGVVAATGEGMDMLRDQIDGLMDAPTRQVTLDIAALTPDFAWGSAVAAKVLSTDEVVVPLSERIDRIVLNRFLGIPIFLLVMYLMFTFAVNVGAVFIDFFDILFGAVLVDGAGQLLTALHSPAWLTTLLANGLGGGIQLVATFVPVIGALYLVLSLLEDSGYLSRAAFVVDRLMASLGLPGNAFVPLIVGFGCNVPAVMAARGVGKEADRLLTIIMAPFMSCGARLTVYALFAAAFFPDNGQNVVFALYLAGILVAVLSGWVFRKQVFAHEATTAVVEMPAYHMPIWRNIYLTTWHRLRGFLLRAGKTIVIVVMGLSLMNSMGTDGSFGNENSQHSLLSVTGKWLTPAFAPMGVKEDNWPATVGVFTGLFAKEAVVGTLDSLYQSVGHAGRADEPAQSIPSAIQSAFVSVWDNAKGLSDALTDPLGIRIGDVSDTTQVAEAQGVASSTLTAMSALFAGSWGAVCYLVFILLYSPCVAMQGAINREAGGRWLTVVMVWTTSVAYTAATVLFQLSLITTSPLSAGLIIAACVAWMALLIFSLKYWAYKAPKVDEQQIDLKWEHDSMSA